MSDIGLLKIFYLGIDLFHIVRYCFSNNALSLYGSYDQARETNQISYLRIFVPV